MHKEQFYDRQVFCYIYFWRQEIAKNVKHTGRISTKTG